MAVRAGTAGNDTISGTRNDDLLAGLAGDDRITGGNGNDIISGGKGSDRLIGGRGDDILIMDTDDRLVNGGQGNDVAILYGSDRHFTLDNHFRNVEGVQDMPRADTTVTMDADVLEHLDGDSFHFALGDGRDVVRIIGGDPEDFHKQGGNLIWDDRVTLSFEGVERISLVSDRDGHSKIISFDGQDHQAGGLTGPDSPAGKTADALGKDRHDGDIGQQADITQFAQAGKGGSIDQDAAIKQWASASGGGDVSQSANISQSATIGGIDTLPQGWDGDGARDFFHLT